MHEYFKTTCNTDIHIFFFGIFFLLTTYPYSYFTTGLIFQLYQVLNWVLSFDYEYDWSNLLHIISSPEGNLSSQAFVFKIHNHVWWYTSFSTPQSHLGNTMHMKHAWSSLHVSSDSWVKLEGPIEDKSGMFWNIVTTTRPWFEQVAN